MPKPLKIYNHFYSEQTELKGTLLYEAQQLDPVNRQLLFRKRYKNYHSIPSKFILANKGLLHYYRRLQNLIINETNHLLYYIQETTSQKIFLPLSLLLVMVHVKHFHDLLGHIGREKTHATIKENYYFPNNYTWIAIITQGCLNC